MRSIKLGALAGAVALSLSSVASADLVYDYTSGSLFTTSRPTNVGDFGVFSNALGALGPNERYEIDSLSVARVQGGAGTAGGTVDIGFFLWDDVNTSGGAGVPVFSNLIGWGFFQRTVAAEGGASSVTTAVTIADGAMITDDSTFGYQMVYATAGSIQVNGDTVSFTPTASGMTSSMRGIGASAQGSSSNGWLQDQDGDGILESTEFFAFGAPNDVNSNIYLQVNASKITIPEPGSAGLLALGALTLLRRRR